LAAAEGNKIQFTMRALWPIPAVCLCGCRPTPTPTISHPRNTNHLIGMNPSLWAAELGQLASWQVGQLPARQK